MPTLRKLTAPLFGAALLLAAAPVSAGGFYTGNDLLKFCRGPDPGEAGYTLGAYNACVAYLAGMNDAEGLWTAWGLKTNTFCIPEGASLGQLRHAFMRYMDQHPEHWHLAAARLAALAFLEAWPCPD